MYGHYEASFYAEGVREVLSALGERFEAEMASGLCSSADWNSRVMWPSELAGAPLFDFVPAPEPAGLWKRLKHKFLSPLDLFYTDGVKWELLGTPELPGGLTSED